MLKNKRKEKRNQNSDAIPDILCLLPFQSTYNHICYKGKGNEKANESEKIRKSNCR